MGGLRWAGSLLVGLIGKGVGLGLGLGRDLLACQLGAGVLLLARGGSGMGWDEWVGAGGLFIGF